MHRFYRLISVFVLGNFLFFQVVLDFHTHKSNDSADHCSLCQIIHHTPTTVNPHPATFTPHIIYQSSLFTTDEIIVSDYSGSNLKTRAPPHA